MELGIVEPEAKDPKSKKRKLNEEKQWRPWMAFFTQDPDNLGYCLDNYMNVEKYVDQSVRHKIPNLGFSDSDIKKRKDPNEFREWFRYARYGERNGIRLLKAAHWDRELRNVQILDSYPNMEDLADRQWGFAPSYFWSTRISLFSCTGEMDKRSMVDLGDTGMKIVYGSIVLKNMYSE